MINFGLESMILGSEAHKTIIIYFKRVGISLYIYPHEFRKLTVQTSQLLFFYCPPGESECETNRNAGLTA